MLKVLKLGVNGSLRSVESVKPNGNWKPKKFESVKPNCKGDYCYSSRFNQQYEKPTPSVILFSTCKQ